MKSTYHPFFQNFGNLSKAVRSLEKVVEFNTFVDVKNTAQLEIFLLYNKQENKKRDQSIYKSYSVMDVLISPIQRIPRLILLLGELDKVSFGDENIKAAIMELDSILKY